VTIKDETDGQYYVILKAGNHKEIARSCPSEQEANLAWLFPLAAAAILPTVPTVETPHVELAVASPVVNEREDDYLACNRYANQGLPDIDGIVQFF